LNFYRPLNGAGGLGINGRGAAAEEWELEGSLKFKNRPPTDYLYPGGIAATGLRTASGSEVKACVLGPPRSAELSRCDPRKGEAYLHEAYLLREQPLAFELFAHRLGLSSSRSATPGPFDASWIESRNKVPRPWKAQKIEESLDNWRDIPNRLALRLESDTNNTTLVLALTLGEDGPVLLFTGDAQAGNWRSWHEVQFAQKGAGVALDARNLLGRAVFYKVGHHASHNATMRELGLELMTDRDLAAMIPLDVATARKNKWPMPHPPLKKRLTEMTAGRLIQADELAEAEKNRKLHGRVEFGPQSKVLGRPLFVEYFIDA
jgi:hypothetical protein